MSEPCPGKEAAPAECPVCYEKFQPLEATHRRLSCGHSFCHDCLVKCLLAAKLDGHVQSSIVCPVCRFVTFLSEKKAPWPPKGALEMPLSPSSLCQLAKSEASNVLVVPSHFVMPLQSPERCPAGLLARDAHIFIISERGVPLLGGRGGEDVAVPSSVVPGSVLPGSAVPGPAVPGSALALQCCQSPMGLAVMLVLTVALLAAVLPWLLLVRREL